MYVELRNVSGITKNGRLTRFSSEDSYKAVYIFQMSFVRRFTAGQIVLIF